MKKIFAILAVIMMSGCQLASDTKDAVTNVPPSVVDEIKAAITWLLTTVLNVFISWFGALFN